MTSADKTVRLTAAQAVVTYLSRQYSVADGQRRRLIPATLGIFGHGNVAGLGQALDQLSDAMPFIQGRNEQALVHAATAFAKHSRRHATLAVTASIGPGALNMVTGAALATVNRLPVLLLPGDTYATRHQGPVLQQLQHPLEADVTVNDAFRPVCRFFDRITRPEQLLTALPAAMRVLTDPVDAGAVVLSLPQDIQSYAYDFPAGFFAERDWIIRRPQPDASEVDAVLAMLAAATRPLIIAGGGVIYSGATAELERLAASAGIPVARDLRREGRRAAAGLVADRRHRPGGHPRGQRAGPRGRPGADRGGPADRLRHRLPLAVRQPRGAVREHQRHPARRRPARRHRHHRRRQAGAGRAGRRRRPGGPPHARGLAGPRRGGDRRVGRGPGGRARTGPAVRPGRRRPGRRDHHGRGPDPGPAHRGPAGTRAARATW